MQSHFLQTIKSNIQHQPAIKFLYPTPLANVCCRGPCSSRSASCKYNSHAPLHRYQSMRPIHHLSVHRYNRTYILSIAFHHRESKVDRIHTWILDPGKLQQQIGSCVPSPTSRRLDPWVVEWLWFLVYFQYIWKSWMPSQGVAWRRRRLAELLQRRSLYLCSGRERSHLKEERVGFWSRWRLMH